MTLKVSNAGVNAEVDALTALLNGGTAKLYTGSQPASADDAATGTLLADIALNNPAFNSAVDGAADINASTVPQGAGVAAGDAGYLRFVTPGAAAVFDCTVSAVGGGGEAIIDKLSIEIGDPVRLLSFQFVANKG